MTYRVSVGEMKQVLQVLQRCQPWRDYSLQCQEGGWRLEANGGSRDISPRGSKREVTQYMRAMLVGIDAENDERERERVAAAATAAPKVFSIDLERD